MQLGKTHSASQSYVAAMDLWIRWSIWHVFGKESKSITTEHPEQLGMSPRTLHHTGCNKSNGC